MYWGILSSSEVWVLKNSIAEDNCMLKKLLNTGSTVCPLGWNNWLFKGKQNGSKPHFTLEAFYHVLRWGICCQISNSSPRLFVFNCRYYSSIKSIKHTYLTKSAHTTSLYVHDQVVFMKLSLLYFKSIIYIGNQMKKQKRSLQTKFKNHMSKMVNMKVQRFSADMNYN